MVFRTLGTLCDTLILFATEPFGFVRHLPSTHTWGPRNVMAESEENEVVEVAFCLRLQPFRTHPIITAWQQLVLEVQHGSRSRCTILALVGEAYVGKSCKGMSIFGRSRR